MEKNILLTIEYDGSGFSGWQRQPGRRTVQGVLEEALCKILRQPVELQGTSRTDAGVHALGQRATLRGNFGIPTARLPLTVNHILAGQRGGLSKIGRVGDVRILAAEEKAADFHARFSARGKLYRYVISTAETPDIFRRNYCYQVGRPLDIAAMRQAAACLQGTHDFCCFQAAGGQPRATTVRTIARLAVLQQGEDIVLEVAGDGFLYHMVRILTGTLVEVGLGRRSPAEMPEILAGRDRSLAGHTAPAAGLYLAEVYYEEMGKGDAKDGKTGLG